MVAKLGRDGMAAEPVTEWVKIITGEVKFVVIYPLRLMPLCPRVESRCDSLLAFALRQRPRSINNNKQSNVMPPP